MALEDQEVISAQVVLRSASGKAPDGESVVTAATLADFAPAPEAVARAAEGFRERGFDVGSAVGNNFSITASAGTFERVFDVPVHRTERGGLAGPDGETLRLDKLPDSLSRIVAAVTFIPPPDFGPGSFA
jgi:hypothetical protein